MKYVKSTNKQRRERGDWPNNGTYKHISQYAWMEEVHKPGGVVTYVPRYSEGKTYRKSS